MKDQIEMRGWRLRQRLESKAEGGRVEAIRA